MRVINLPAIEKTVSLKAYVAGIKAAKANPEQMFKHGLTTWWATSGAEIMAQFWFGVQDRINQAVPYMDRGKGAEK